jgi:hypothetical protein
MAYSCDIGNGRRILVQNHGEETQVALSSGDSGQQQNQSTTSSQLLSRVHPNFRTSRPRTDLAWPAPAVCFCVGENVVIEKAKRRFGYATKSGLEPRQRRLLPCSLIRSKRLYYSVHLNIKTLFVGFPTLEISSDTRLDFVR